ncbi:hypothetical protein JCM11641_008199 [Rhodosporidiobolus odoratus]
MSLEAITNYLEGRIDFDGQDLAEQRIGIVLWAAAAISFLAGLALQDLRVTFALFGLGYLGCLGWVVPPLPAYRASPVKWLDTLDEYGETQEVSNSTALQGVDADPAKKR